MVVAIDLGPDDVAGLEVDTSIRGRKRVARLMRGAGLQGVSRRKAVRTTVRDDMARPAPDLVERHFTAAGPNQLWVADITYVPTWAGFLYLAVVVDANEVSCLGDTRRSVATVQSFQPES